VENRLSAHRLPPPPATLHSCNKNLYIQIHPNHTTFTQIYKILMEKLKMSMKTITEISLLTQGKNQIQHWNGNNFVNPEIRILGFFPLFSQHQGKMLHVPDVTSFSLEIIYPIFSTSPSISGNFKFSQGSTV
jgi:hypothetical protein